jgi:hypothetical protein
MKSRRSAGGPFAEKPFFTDSDIESMCVDELSKQGLLPDSPGPIRIDRFIEKRFGKPHVYEELPEGVLGVTRFGAKGVQEIVVASFLEEEATKTAERRLRTTLAHEAGHALLHAFLFVLGQQKPLFGDWTESQKPKVLCRDASSEWWEVQANMVIGPFLMPKPLVQKALFPYMTDEGVFGTPTLPEGRREEAARDLAEVFNVNPAVARIRLEKLFPVNASGQMTF